MKKLIQYEFRKIFQRRLTWVAVLAVLLLSFVILHGLMMHKTKNIGIVHQKILSLKRKLTLMYTIHMI